MVHRQINAPDRELVLAGLAAAFVTLGVLALWLAPAARTGQWQAASPVPWVILPVWFGCAALSLAATRRSLPGHDPLLLPAVLLLSGWGLLLIWRLAPGFGLRQAGWLGVAAAACAGIMRLPGDLRWLRRFRYTWLLGGLALTAATLLFGVNPAGQGQRLWLGCCGVYLQPAEILKLLLVAFLASYLAERRPPASRLLPLRHILPMLVVWGFSLLLLVLQRDLGMSTLFFGVFIAMLYAATGRARYLLAGAALLAAAGAIGFALFDVVQRRVLTWWNPWADPTGDSFQVVQSLIAIASGGLFGRGPGLGAPGLIPVVHSDFVFAALGEEWGLAGMLAAVALLSLVVARGFHIAAGAARRFEQLLAAGLTSLLALQTIMIMGGVIRLLPLTGLTLPFLSYGGSSLVTQFILVGLLLRVSAARPEAGPGRPLEAGG